MTSVAIDIPPAEIAYFKAVIESYDNLATLRTEDRTRHRLRLWFDETTRAEIEALLSELSAQFSIHVIAAPEP
ncbi:MAG TPA: DUF4911 domain-containing protein [Candidatus Binataceae bacterium]|jgi:hypothetical protein